MIELLDKCLNHRLIQIILSNTKTRSGVSKVKIRPITVKEQIMFQITEYIDKKVIHQNENKSKTIDYIVKNLGRNFRQAQIQTTAENYTVLVSKKGKVTISGKKNSEIKPVNNLSHNRKKNYLLKEGIRVEFLVDLGIMTNEGKIINAKYDKYKQINRFLEFVEDILPQLDKDRQVNIIDFGCGKSYLTFAIYYFLKELRGYDVNIIGLDLKEDVIESCNALRKKYGYHNLNFIKGNIADYAADGKVDMVVSLHACDTATDYAIAKAVKWNAKVIMAVPCCQHEINGQIKNELLAPILEYGILRDRLSAVITDGLRAKLLEGQGYDTQILEFIEMEHTPKNLLIRAIKSEGHKHVDVSKLIEELNVKPTLKNLLD